ncbi:DUF4135 domain-containing protein [Streptomyces sp. NPDC006997]|uniref:DUF4135 domain-containing protein n=1 Tax=Streptomyces sp. NPDC006997 TaxID=3155356 RepID=UPI0033D426DC
MSGDLGVLYADSLHRATTRLDGSLGALSPQVAPQDADACLRPVRNALERQLRQAVLPVVCGELARARQARVLRGATPEERYRDFWDRETLTPELLAKRYPVVASEIEVIATTTVDAVVHAARSLARDIEALSGELPDARGRLLDVNPVGSDRHAGGRQVISLGFDGGRVYYKPVSLASADLLHRFVELAGVPSELWPGRLRTVDRGGYGWLEEAKFRPCTEVSQVRRFWRRCGVLLAVCCLLNFTDGHFENLVAAGEHPVLVDTETLFQNYAWRSRGGRLASVVDTGLVQHAGPAAPPSGMTSAFQVMGGGRLSSLSPAADGEGTDTMAVRFQRTLHEPPVNLPVLASRFQTVDGYVEELVDGFRTVFSLCRQRRNEILGDSEFWDRAAAHESRQIIRETRYYVRLLRLTEQPDYAVSPARAEHMITDWLRFEEPDNRYNTLVADEVAALKGFDIPYFGHRVSGVALASASAEHAGFFPTSALTQIRGNISDWDEPFVDAQCALLRENLSVPPGDTALSPMDERLLDQLTHRRHPAAAGPE